MTIKIYSTPSCGYCKVAKEFLTSHGVEYTEVDVAADVNAREEMVDKSGQLGVPVFDINGQIIVGYNEQLLSKVVGIGGQSADAAAGSQASAE
ncbi:MAG TPA: glutaredoxin domain-containing protein [Candidatus Paceibacterota bacterium]